MMNNEPMPPADPEIATHKENLGDEETLELERRCREGDKKACEERDRYS
jgi:hypothetical protein